MFTEPASNARRLVLAALLSLILGDSDASADDSKNVVNTMKRIAAAWQEASDKGTWFLNPCSGGALNGSWAAIRLTITDLKYDVKKTDSLISPIMGLITFEEVQTSNNNGPRAEIPQDLGINQPNPNYCYRSKETALADISDSDQVGFLNGRPYEMRVTYTEQDGYLVINDYNEVFKNGIYNSILVVEQEPNRSFAAKVARVKIK